MNAVDLLLLVIVLLGAWSGVRRGFVRAALFLGALVASLGAAFFAYRYPAMWLLRYFPEMGVWAQPISFLFCFVVFQVVLDTISQRLIAAVPARAHAHGLNAALGAVPGLGSGAINATVIALVLMSAPMPAAIGERANDSLVAERLARPADWIESKLAPIFDPAIRRTLQSLTVPVDSTQTVQLPFKVTQAQPRPDLEARMLQMVNAERAQAGLRPLRPDAELTDVARAHSRDMFLRGYFSHVSPDGGTLAQRVRAADVRYVLVGENLALANTLTRAHQGLMDSPGHRANILRPQFGRLGIGVLDGGRHGLMVTQNFRN